MSKRIFRAVAIPSAYNRKSWYLATYCRAAEANMEMELIAAHDQMSDEEIDALIAEDTGMTPSEIDEAVQRLAFTAANADSHIEREQFLGYGCYKLPKREKDKPKENKKRGVVRKEVKDVTRLYVGHAAVSRVAISRHSRAKDEEVWSIPEVDGSATFEDGFKWVGDAILQKERRRRRSDLSEAG